MDILIIIFILTGLEGYFGIFGHFNNSFHFKFKVKLTTHLRQWSAEGHNSTFFWTRGGPPGYVALICDEAENRVASGVRGTCGMEPRLGAGKRHTDARTQLADEDGEEEEEANPAIGNILSVRTGSKSISIVIFYLGFEFVRDFISF